ncbi:UDP-N-acetylmuramoyl-L-alanine--D-glutamate ligase [Pseudocolwellia agarivorans]|uniref:UDP-N-acetylmuramoyl-L-alanine--D-glutamate ligase n=1 Tax=Pseudocolwellia agarivorans TaxID=1911682 RepID=UPI000986D69B|nr:UDP-N-acetylmuramoyl-L-alanine--D-glutamate ligase [Pseudocolwellia agarivorans]
MQKLAHFKNKNIVVLGAGLTGLSCVRFLQNNNIPCAVNDSRENPIDLSLFKTDFPNTELYTGSWNANLIRHAEVLLVSPGVDLNDAAIRDNISNTCEVIGDVELYCQLSNTPIIAVTGSNGKSTVVSLLHYLGNQLGYKTQLGGNIGVPVLDIINEEIDYLVLELSSFQLETLRSMKAKAASILNISDDHLDRHKTIENYTAIKHAIYPQSSVAVINRDDSATHTANDVVSKQVSFGSDQPKLENFGITAFNEQSYLMYGDEKLIALNELPLAGMHNALNYLAALALGMNAGWSLSLMVSHLAGFKGLPHRCQRVESQDDVHWINDSKATNVGATIAAIKGLSYLAKAGQKLILIAGGDGKGADFSPLKSVIDKHVDLLYTLGKDGDKIAELVKHSATNSIHVSSIDEAVHLAHIVVKSGDIVLLSPACASIDMFKNFAERGQVFTQAVYSVQGVS